MDGIATSLDNEVLVVSIGFSMDSSEKHQKHPEQNLSDNIWVYAPFVSSSDYRHAKVLYHGICNPSLK
jgi:hypothetical protein